jgi:hypothetical protein
MGEYRRIQLKHELYKKEILLYVLVFYEAGEKYYNDYLKDMFDLIHIPFDDQLSSLYTQSHKLQFIKRMSKMSNKINRIKFMDVLLSIYMVELNLYSSLIVIPMDIYFLTRIFTSFDELKIKRGPKGCRSLKDASSYNIIMYGGDTHAQVYASFIMKYFGVSPLIDKGNINDNNKCLSFHKPFDFFTFGI